MEEFIMQGLLLDVALEAANIAKEHRNEFVTPEHVVAALTNKKYKLFKEDNADALKSNLELYFSNTQLPNDIKCDPVYSDSLIRALSSLDDKPNITYFDILEAMMASTSDLIGDFTHQIDMEYKEKQSNNDKNLTIKLVDAEKTKGGSVDDTDAEDGKLRIGYISGVPPYIYVLPEIKNLTSSLTDAADTVERFLSRSEKALGFTGCSPTYEDAIREILGYVHMKDFNDFGNVENDYGRVFTCELNLQALALNKSIEMNLFDALTEIVNIVARLGGSKGRKPLLFISHVKNAIGLSSTLALNAISALIKIADSMGVTVVYSGGDLIKLKTNSYESASYISEFGLKYADYLHDLTDELPKGVAGFIEKWFENFEHYVTISYDKFIETLNAYHYDGKITLMDDEVTVNDSLSKDSILYKTYQATKEWEFGCDSEEARPDTGAGESRDVLAKTKYSKEPDTDESLYDRLRKCVFGQDKAIDTLCEFISIHEAGLSDPTKPIGNFLFVGPTGVGKTELARSLANEMGYNLLRYDMSEFSEGHSVAKFTGSPAGYVGYDDSRTLVDEINSNPKCVLLLDEIEKAHPKVYGLLLQIMDSATLTNGRGVKADFKDVVLIMTSNAGAADSKKLGIGFNNEDFNKTEMKYAVERTFTPEFRGRLSAVVEFNDLTKDIYGDIVRKELWALSDRAWLSNKIDVKFSTEAVDYIVSMVDTSRHGAREIKSFILQKVATKLGEAIKKYKAESDKPESNKPDTLLINTRFANDRAEARDNGILVEFYYKEKQNNSKEEQNLGS